MITSVVPEGGRLADDENEKRVRRHVRLSEDTPDMCQSEQAKDRAGGDGISVGYGISTPAMIPTVFMFDSTERARPRAQRSNCRQSATFGWGAGPNSRPRQSPDIPTLKPCPLLSSRPSVFGY
jgi:hypothetical protein